MRRLTGAAVLYAGLCLAGGGVFAERAVHRQVRSPITAADRAAHDAHCRDYLKVIIFSHGPGA